MGDSRRERPGTMAGAVALLNSRSLLVRRQSCPASVASTPDSVVSAPPPLGAIPKNARQASSCWLHSTICRHPRCRGSRARSPAIRPRRWHCSESCSQAFGSLFARHESQPYEQPTMLTAVASSALCLESSAFTSACFLRVIDYRRRPGGSTRWEGGRQALVAECLADPGRPRPCVR